MFKSNHFSFFKAQLANFAFPSAVESYTYELPWLTVFIFQGSRTNSLVFQPVPHILSGVELSGDSLRKVNFYAYITAVINDSNDNIF